MEWRRPRHIEDTVTSAARVAVVEAADGEREVDEAADGERRADGRSFVGEGNEESRLLRRRHHRGYVGPAACRSLSLMGPPRRRPGCAALWEDAEEAIPVPVVAMKLLSPSSSSSAGGDSSSAKGWNRNTSWGTDVYRSPSPPNASLDCIAQPKSGERLVPQPGDALHRGEPARMEKQTSVGEGTTQRHALVMALYG
uniref:Uncharacterized protein n=1 Tax=Oryza rufipogon TaxID=4529 RepID=A0A0E0QGW6_ORYRU